MRLEKPRDCSQKQRKESSGSRCSAMCWRRRTRMRVAGLSGVQAAHALLVDRPALAAQQHPDPQEAERGGRARSRGCDGGAPSGLRPAAAAPRRATELRQVTGPHAADTEGRLDPAGQLAALCGPRTVFRRASVGMCLSKREVRHHALQSPVLILEPPELAQLADAQVRVLPDLSLDCRRFRGRRQAH